MKLIFRLADDLAARVNAHLLVGERPGSCSC
jgi:hypothetical protein